VKRTRHVEYVAGIEQILRQTGRPFVAVDDARKAIFSGARIVSFDFLVYMPQGDHLLVTVLPKSRPKPTVGQQDALRQWQRVFGAGFVGAFVHATDEPIAWLLEENPARPRPLRSVLMADAMPDAAMTDKESSNANVELRTMRPESPGQL
jgi:hypothetical protein